MKARHENVLKDQLYYLCVDCVLPNNELARGVATALVSGVMAYQMTMDFQNAVEYLAELASQMNHFDALQLGKIPVSWQSEFTRLFTAKGIKVQP